MEQPDKNRVPEFQSNMLPILQYLKDNEPRALQEVMDHIAQLHKLTEEELRDVACFTKPSRSNFSFSIPHQFKFN